MRRYGYNPSTAKGKFAPGVRVGYQNREGRLYGYRGTLVERSTQFQSQILGSHEVDYWLVAWDGLGKLTYPETHLRVMDE